MLPTECYSSLVGYNINGATLTNLSVYGPGCLSRFQMLAFMLSLRDLLYSSGGSDGESGLDLLRDEGGNSDEGSGYRALCKYSVLDKCDMAKWNASCINGATLTNLSVYGLGYLSRFQMLASMLSLRDLLYSSGGSDGESGLDLLRDEGGNSDEGSGYRALCKYIVLDKCDMEKWNASWYEWAMA
nr:hypothetical protein [Tanacetum cinerariifolium]